MFTHDVIQGEKLGQVIDVTQTPADALRVVQSQREIRQLVVVCDVTSGVAILPRIYFEHLFLNSRWLRHRNRSQRGVRERRQHARDVPEVLATMRVCEARAEVRVFDLEEEVVGREVEGGRDAVAAVEVAGCDVATSIARAVRKPLRTVTLVRARAHSRCAREGVEQVLATVAMVVTVFVVEGERA